ncbi:nucleotidyltransferase family protein [Hoeflea prorocentri]|uniref:Nucleotidyltransferase family protein n=1 Tax=Hoeflea prorocentri TaxID=1922333 RepID=A0A9X3ZIP1_9HYPH|nr:nucleotidyltransferase family protein [Hoeflea prorocentri]MCY6383127.1 nucleotidyltransferase family protein [Hoeflea prorocentri]MDA5400927.1 nucleotidyltransferase family protein [Hoeflea prorocentri]
MPDTAMILAAGLGKRMRPITDTLPKPLVPVDGRPMIDYLFDSLEEAGVRRIVVNVHYLADQLVGHISARMGDSVIISDERAELLESGGGVVRALPMLGTEPFYILNADTFWLDRPGGRPHLSSLAEAWDPQRMDMLLTVAAMDNVIGYGGKGDFQMDSENRIARYDGMSRDPFVNMGAAIVSPSIFDHAPAGPFSLNRCYDEAIARGRLFGLHGDGLWLTIGTPEAIGEAEEAMDEFRSERAAGPHP